MNLHSVEIPNDKPPLLLLHGVTRNYRDWLPILPLLTPHFHVVMLDLRGHGESDRAKVYKVIDYVSDVVQFIRERFSKPIAIMGHSLGAMVALNVASECPELVSHLVLEDPPFHTMGERIAETPYQAQFAGMQAVCGMQLTNIEAITDALSEILLPTPGGMARMGDLRDRDSLRFSAECLRLVDTAVYTPLISGHWLDGFAYQEMWSNVQCPTLLLQGDPSAGGAFTNEDVSIARKELKHSQHIPFPNVGHLIHRTRPEEVVRALISFVQAEPTH